MTQSEMHWVVAYNDSHNLDLSDVYSRWSREKELAFRHCYKTMQEEGGHYLRIISANTYHFTVAWMRPDGKMHVVTPFKDYVIDLSKLPF